MTCSCAQREFILAPKHRNDFITFGGCLTSTPRFPAFSNSFSFMMITSTCSSVNQLVKWDAFYTTHLAFLFPPSHPCVDHVANFNRFSVLRLNVFLRTRHGEFFHRRNARQRRVTHGHAIQCQGFVEVNVEGNSREALYIQPLPQRRH